MYNLTKMKNTIKNLSVLLLIILCMGACKKDALQVNEEKEFIQVNAATATDLVGGGVDLLLKPNGIAGINPGGDIVWNATYDISGNKLPVKIKETNTKYQFTIISDEEIHGQNGEILKLVKK